MVSVGVTVGTSVDVVGVNLPLNTSLATCIGDVAIPAPENKPAPIAPYRAPVPKPSPAPEDRWIFGSISCKA